MRRLGKRVAPSEKKPCVVCGQQDASLGRKSCFLGRKSRWAEERERRLGRKPQISLTRNIASLRQEICFFWSKGNAFSWRRTLLLLGEKHCVVWASTIFLSIHSFIHSFIHSLFWASSNACSGRTPPRRRTKNIPSPDPKTFRR